MHSSGAVASPVGDQKGSSGLVSCVPDLSGLPFPCSAKELRDEQANDPGLVELFKNVLSLLSALSAACGYFMDNGDLFRKWVPHWDEFVGEAIVQVRGLLSVLGDVGKASAPPESVEAYVLNFKDRLSRVRDIAKANLEGVQDKMKRLYDRTVERRSLEVGDQVLVIRPLVGSPFESKFDGPFEVIRKVSDENYLVSTPPEKKIYLVSCE
ncbi:hypothetical protein N1851_008429 [Merluccius polli]|uniref:Uncharacterized protein n=1 Tax=Merluccius polli TaxID=89951 RepID=A0AA47N2H0_MERPO|nr:hypothetical protein N1851_008429 [Merluccius polli]